LLCIWYKEGEEVAQRGTHVVDGGVMRCKIASVNRGRVCVGGI
jgi:hypothetical protein